MPNNSQSYHPWLYRFAMLTTIATLVLIVVGGLVTSTDAGLAVPDWPTTFGYNMFLYPLSKTVSGFLFSLPSNLQVDLEAGVLSERVKGVFESNEMALSEQVTISTSEPGRRWKISDGHHERTYTVIRAGERLDMYVPGVLYEHSHRLIGSGVGILTVTLAIMLWVVDSRRWLKWLGIVALVAVILQGIMGGLRVVHLSRTLAVVHACFAQAFFALVASIALVTSSVWGEKPAEIQTTEASRLRRLSLFTALIIYVQLIFGAVLRHTGTQLHAHLLFAVLVTVHIFLLTKRLLSYHLEHKGLVRSAVMLSLALALQLALGITSYLGELTTVSSVMPFFVRTAVSTSHVAIGALMFVTAVLLTLRIHQITKVPEAVVNQKLVSEGASG